MNAHIPKTKIVATLGPASNSTEILRRLVQAGMSVARLNFSHGNYEDHIHTLTSLRSISLECASPVTILQDLQGPKIRVGHLPNDQMTLIPQEWVTLVPSADYQGQPGLIPIDYPRLASAAPRGARVLLDDGRLELRVEDAPGQAVRCMVVDGGVLRSRKGVVLPDVDLPIPSLTDKDLRDLEFGIAQEVDWIALSFVRRADDVRRLKEILAQKGARIPVLAKIETPEAVLNLDEILDEVDGLMVARGDLGVALSPEKVPMLQKRMIRKCNERGIPVITATQMLESMISEPRPTRAEASDVANAIIDGTDCIMLSGESAVGKYPVRAVEMMVRIALEVEPSVQCTHQPPRLSDETHALSQAVTAIDRTLSLRCIAAFTTRGYTARLVSAERPRAPVYALTADPRTFHGLNLLWGVKPLLIDRNAATFEEILDLTEGELLKRNLVTPGDKILIAAGLPMGSSGGTNLLRIHTVGMRKAGMKGEG